MDCPGGENSTRKNGHARSVKPDTDRTDPTDQRFPNTLVETGVTQPCNAQMRDKGSAQKPNAYSGLIPDIDENGRAYCNEEQVKDIALENLEKLYNTVLSWLKALWYDEDTALKAMLVNGYGHGNEDVLTNIMVNTLAYLKTGLGANGEDIDDTAPHFIDFKHMQKWTLKTMVSLLQENRRDLSRGAAMWCLLMSNFHLGQASLVELPPHSDSNECKNPSGSKVESVDKNSSGSKVESVDTDIGGFGYGGCSEASSQKESNLTPSMKSLLEKNVAAIIAGYRANKKHLKMQSQAYASSSNEDSLTAPNEPKKETTPSLVSQDIVRSLLSELGGLNLDEIVEGVSEEQKDEAIVRLTCQVKDLERQVQEREVWAQKKAIQAARKLSNDLMELKTLRMEREEAQRLKMSKHTHNCLTMKVLSEVEDTLRKNSGQLDRANAAVRKLEAENAEFRSEIEASKLSTSESAATCLELAKREKKTLKRQLAWEKQKTKFREEIAVVRETISEKEQELVNIVAAQREAEVKCGQEQKAKDLALSQVQEEHCLKEAAEVNSRRKLKALCQKTQIDFQLLKDDLQRLEQELSQLKVSNNSVSMVNSEGTQKEAMDRIHHELENLDVSDERECLFCMEDEVSVVFLPCAHQVLCSSCNSSYENVGGTTCPSCRVPIEERIHIFGACS